MAEQFVTLVLVRVSNRCDRDGANHCACNGIAMPAHRGRLAAAASSKLGPFSGDSSHRYTSGKPEETSVSRARHTNCHGTARH